MTGLSVVLQDRRARRSEVHCSEVGYIIQCNQWNELVALNDYVMYDK